MTRESHGLPELTREEWLYVDGALDPEAMRRMEARLDADPVRRAAIEAWRSTTALWSEDARRAARPFDPERVLDSSARGAEGRIVRDPEGAAPGARRWAAAAILLAAIGIGGTAALALSTRPETPGATALAIESDRLRLQGAREILALPLSRPTAKGG